MSYNEKEKTLEQLKIELSYKDKIISSFIELSQIIASEKPAINEILNEILSIVDETMEIEASSIIITDERTNELKFIAATGPKTDAILKYRLNVGEGIAGKVMTTGEPIIIFHTENDNTMKKEISKEINYNVGNIMCFPLMVQKRTIGVLEAMNKKGNDTFSELDIKLMQFMASQAAILVENSLLMDKYAKQLTELNTLIDLLTKLSSTLDMNYLVSQMMTEIKRLTDCDSASIIMQDDETQDLYFYMVTDNTTSSIDKVTMPPGQGIAGSCIKTGESYIINDVMKNEKFYNGVDKATGFITRNMICVPIKIRGNIVGAVEAVNKRNEEDFDNEDLKILDGLGSQIGIALTNAQIYSDLKAIFYQTVKTLAAAIDAKDPYTHGHSERVKDYSLMIAKELKLSQLEMERIELSALLHDVGKIGIEDVILKKEGKLTDEEYLRIKQHPVIGNEIMKPIKSLAYILPGILYHHEKWDGTGYPKGLLKEDIPFVGRIIAIADSYDAMTSNRPYRKALTKEEAFNELKKYSDKQFDSQLVEIFLKIMDKA